MRATLLALLCALATGARAEQIIQAPTEFVAGAFPDEQAQAAVAWLTGDLRATAEEILGHPPDSLRVRYWHQGARSAWILEEIGKELPITAGFVIEGGAIKQARVLIYRESRGGEIRVPSFLRQFRSARLDDGRKLDRGIDNITGATLSVRAMKRMAELALALDAARS